MKKWNRALVAALMALCLLVISGCSQLFSMHDRPTPTVEPSPTATAMVMATPTLTPEEPTPTATEEPTPTVAPTLAPLPKNLIELARFAVDIDEDGAKETVVVATTDEDYGLVYVGVLSPDGFERALAADESEGWFADAYLGAAPNGAPCLLTTVDIGSDDYITSVFAFSGGKPVLKDELGVYVAQVDGSSVMVRDDLFVIGSWMYTCEYKITPDFTLRRVSEMIIDTGDREPMHTVQPLPVEMLVGGVYVADTLPIGTLLTPVATDGMTYMSFTLQDGSEGRILFMFGDYRAYIDGVPADDYFDNLEYWD